MSTTVFMAIELPEDTREICVGLQNRLREKTAGSFPVKENLHITIAYAGEVDDAKLEEVKRIFTSLDYPRHTIVLDHLHVFAGRKGDQIVFAGRAEEAFLAYRRKLIASLAEAGIATDPKPFLPHVTLVRAKTRNIDTADLSAEPLTVVSKRGVLFSSRQEKGRRIYEPLAHTKEVDNEKL